MAEPKRREKEKAVQQEVGAPVAADLPRAQARSGTRLTRSGWITLGVVIAIINAPLIHYALFRRLPEATVPLPYADDFSSPERLAENYSSTGGLWRIENGELKSPGVRNNPLWLKAALPQNVAVEFDARSESPEGDIKVELFGDGSDHATGYVFIHGGWNNSMSIIARLDEHGKDFDQLKRAGTVFTEKTRMRVQANPFKVERGRVYRWRIERRGGLITWTIDGQPFMSFDDPVPLTGPGNDRFGFSSWDATLIFDNLKIEPL